MNHASLFSGIGGFDLAAEWCGWKNVFHCEIDPFCQKVLAYHFPNSEQFTDITQSDFSKYANRIDILTGGFPCQPFSVAGKREGSEDSRYLWKEMFRVIQCVKPTWVIAENVYGIVSIEGGMVFETVQTDLESQDYEVQPIIIPACSVNAPHKRNRIWFIAYSDNKRRSNKLREISKENGKISEWNDDSEFSDTNYEYATDTTSKRFYERQSGKQSENSKENNSKKNNRIERFGKNEYVTNPKNSRFSAWFKRSKQEQFGRKNIRNSISNYWENFPTVSPICGGNDGISERLDSITFSKWRKESIKAYGNAIVPQVAYQIFQTINDLQQYE